MNNPFISALVLNDQGKIKIFSKLIALGVRNGLEDFHVQHLTDTQMRELNPLIRNAVYDTLFLLANMEKHEYWFQTISLLLRAVPNYWEEPELNDHMKKVYDELINKKVKFQNEFLNEQYRLKNIEYIPSLALVQLAMLHEYKEVKGGDYKKHKAKIIKALQREGYGHDYTLGGYKKVDK